MKFGLQVAQFNWPGSPKNTGAKLVEIARYFDLMTVAEFVQGPAEARILRDLGVEP